MTDDIRFEDPADDDPLVSAARRLAADLLEPAAATVDAGTVPPSHLAALGAAGLLGLEAPEHAGGTAAPARVGRRVTEVLAGADLATWFVQVQHHTPVRAVAAASARRPGAGRGELLADLATGRRIAGIAFSHVRQWPRRPLGATRAGDGSWLLDGVAPWYTGWGLNHVALVGAATADGEVVMVTVPAREQPGLRASDPLDVAVLRGALTVTLTFEGYLVDAADVVSVERVERWLALDAARTANVNPAVFGVAESALRLLLAQGRRRGEPAAVDAAHRLADTCGALRADAYRLLDEVEPGERIAERLRLRAEAHTALVESTTALVVSGAGGSMALTSPAQRKAREALFLLVQAQTAASRAANLEVFGRGAAG